MIKKIWPLFIIILIWLFFSKPFFLDNKVPFPSAYLVNFFSPWNAYPGFSSPVKNNATPDVITQIYPWKNLTIESLESGKLPLWNPYSFSGTTQLANYQSAVLSPFNLIFFILPFINAWSILVLLQSLLAGIFTYFFLKTLKVSSFASTVGAVSFMFCGFLTTWVNYATLGYAILFLPLSLYAIEKFFQTERAKYLILLGISVPLSFFSGHFQISLYFFAFLIAYETYKLFETRNIRKSLFIFTSTVLGLFMSFPQILPSIEAYQQSLRSEIFTKTEAIPWSYLVTFLAPDFLGNPVTRNDWFGHYAEWNGYIGLIPVMLSFLAVIFKRSKTILFFTIASIFAVLLSFNSPILDLIVYFKIPVLATSAASRAVVIYSFSFAILSAFGFDHLIYLIKEKKYKNLTIWLGIFCLIFIFLWSIVVLKLFIPADKSLIARQNLILPSSLFFAFIILLSIFIFIKNKKQEVLKNALLLIIVLLVAFDLFRFATKWLSFDSKALVYPNVPVVEEFKRISSYERVYGNLGGEATNYYKLPSIEGYDAVYNRRYGEFIQSLKDGRIQESARSVVEFPKNGRFSFEALNLLGVKYIVYKTADGHSPWVLPFWNKKEGEFSLIYNDNTYQVLQNNNAFPRAFMVNKYSVKNDPQQVIARMFEENVDLRKEVVLEKNINRKLDAKNMNSKIEIYTSNKISIKTEADGGSILFLSDNFYPGWKAYVDGKETEIYRADYTFRAIFVPKGEHKIIFSYEPKSFYFGVLISFVSLGVLLLLSWRFKRRNSTKI